MEKEQNCKIWKADELWYRRNYAGDWPQLRITNVMFVYVETDIEEENDNRRKSPLSRRWHRWYVKRAELQNSKKLVNSSTVAIMSHIMGRSWKLQMWCLHKFVRLPVTSLFLPYFWVLFNHFLVFFLLFSSKKVLGKLSPFKKSTDQNYPQDEWLPVNVMSLVIRQ